MIEFDWDEANIAHIADHGVTPAQAEEVIWNSPFDLDEQDFEGETRFPQIGENTFRPDSLSRIDSSDR